MHDFTVGFRCFSLFSFSLLLLPKHVNGVWFWSHDNKRHFQWLFQWCLVNFGAAFYEKFLGYLLVLPKSLLLWRWHLVVESAFIFILDLCSSTTAKSPWCSWWWQKMKWFPMSATSYLVINISDCGYQRHFVQKLHSFEVYLGCLNNLRALVYERK